MSRKRTSTKSVKSVNKFSMTLLERVWANHGMIFMEDKKGNTISMEPKMAMFRCRSLNDNLPPEPSAAKTVLKLIEHTLSVIREAMHQRETVDSTTKETGLVMKALDSRDEFARRCSDPVILQKLREAAILYPLLTQQEICAVLLREEISEKMRNDILKAVNKDRYTEYEMKLKEAHKMPLQTA